MPGARVSVTTGARESRLATCIRRAPLRSPHAHLNTNGPPSSCPGERYGVPNKTFISPIYYRELHLYLTILRALLQDARVLPYHSISARVSFDLCESAL